MGKRFSREDALVLRQQGCSYEDIAEQLGCSVSWVKVELRGVERGKNRVQVDGTKIKAIEILKKALGELEAL